jgi:hypothetical protein
MIMKCKFKVGDKVRVVARDKNGNPTKEKYIGRVGTVINVDANYYWQYALDILVGSRWNEHELSEIIDEKIVITHDGKTTTATKYCEDGKKVTATAKCAPEDEFDFNTGAKLAMERLMEAVMPVEHRKYNIGDRIFAEDNINLYPGGAWGTVVSVLDKRHHSEDYLVKFDNGHNLCSHVVTVTAPEPPKYYNGKVVCVDLNGSNKYIYTVGKIYEFVDGTFTCDDGDEVHTWNSDNRFKSFEEWSKFSNSEWIEIKE